jgi:hypothetical protein
MVHRGGGARGGGRELPLTCSQEAATGRNSPKTKAIIKMSATMSAY